MIRTAGGILTAILLSLCFPSGHAAWLAWFALIPLILAAADAGSFRAFRYGYIAGTVFFILTLFWIHHVTPLGLVLLSAYLAVYWGLFAAGAAWSATWGFTRRAVFLASLWTALEYVRAHAFTGFGWSSLAHTQSANILFIQIADITGTYGISFIMVAAAVIAGDLVRTVCRGNRISRELYGLLLGLGLVLGVVFCYGLWRVAAVERMVPGRSVRVALVQPNISLADYGDPLLRSYVVDKHLALSRAAMAQKPDLVVWPETSFPQFIWEQPELFEKLRTFTRENRTRLLFGAVTRSGAAYFNSAVLIDDKGRPAGRYNKQHLVLFGEYIPLRREFPFLEKIVPIDDFTAGKGNMLFPQGRGAFFSTLVCFEDTLPGLARRAAADGAGFLVNITNDAWFGASRQPWMHLDNAVFRAVESRLPLLRATNTGVSCAVMPTGRLSGCVADDKGRSVMVEGVRVVEIPVIAAPITVYTKFGDIFAMLVFIAILGIILIPNSGVEVRNV